MPGIPQGASRPVVLAASRGGLSEMAARLQERTGRTFHFIGAKEELTVERLSALDPEYVFLPHWSHIIPQAVHSAFECVVFHMTDLPFGRGGSPLQNLIVRGIKETRVSALRVGAGIDTGPIYLKSPLDLSGAAEEIYRRAYGVIEEMIVTIIAERPVPKAQEGEPVAFRRRKPEDGDLAPLEELGAVFDYIRMLDAEGYPHAFVEIGHLRIEFTKASLQPDCVVANVRITKK